MKIFTQQVPKQTYSLNKPKQKVSFKSNTRIDLQGFTPNFTYFFRGDFQWRSFVSYLQRKYKNVDKVNIYNTACSDGTEPFTLAISLLSKLGKTKAEKFLPIKAHDLNDSLVKDAKTGVVPLLPFPDVIVDFYKIKVKTLFRDGKYLDFIKHNNWYAAKIKDHVRDKVEFKSGNIFTEIDKMKRENSVLMCRNMWLYLDDFEQQVLAQKLGDRFDKSSLVVIGEYDILDSRAVELLEKNGFEETYINKVFEKVR